MAALALGKFSYSSCYRDYIDLKVRSFIFFLSIGTTQPTSLSSHKLSWGRVSELYDNFRKMAASKSPWFLA